MPELLNRDGLESDFAKKFGIVARRYMQVAATKQMLELPETNLNCPSVRIENCNDFGGDIQQIRGDAKEPVAVSARRSAAILAFGNVRFHLDNDQSHRVIGSLVARAVLADVDDLV